MLARFLANQPQAMRRDVVRLFRPDLLPQMAPWGPSWRALCEELALPCPELVVALGDAMADVFLYFAIDGHTYAMLTPEEARHEHAFLNTMAASYPYLLAPAAMLPVFGEDGDLLLIAADGRVHALGHEEWNRCEVVAGSLTELLDRAVEGALNPPAPDGAA